MQLVLYFTLLFKSLWNENDISQQELKSGRDDARGTIQEEKPKSPGTKLCH